MASDPQTLLAEAKCFICYGVSEDEAIELALLARIASGTVVIPAAPVATDATNDATTQFDSNWNASAGATSYRLDVSTSNLFGSFVPGFQDRNIGNVLTFTVTGLSANTAYFYRVRAVNAAGTSGNSNVISVSTCPNAPTNLLISAASTNGNTVLNWSQSSAPTNNEIWRSTDGGVTFALLSTIAGGLTTFTDAGVIPALGQWYYKVRGTNASCNSSFTDPAGVFNGLSKNNTGAVTWSFPFLQIVYNDFVISSEALLTTISVPILRKVGGQFVNIALPSLVAVDFTSLVSTGAGCGVFDSPLIATIAFPAFVSSGDFFGAARNDGLVNFSAPLLTTIGADLQLYNTNSLGAISLPSLVTVGTGVNISTSNLPSFSAPNFTTLGTGDFNISNCANLVTVTIPSIIFPDGFFVTFDTDALDVASVNSILHRGVVSGTTTSDYELSSGTNAAPAGQGLIDKATLIGAGNTVNTN